MFKTIITTLGPIGLLCQIALAYVMVVKVSFLYAPTMLDIVNQWELIQKDGSMFVTVSILTIWTILAMCIHGIATIIREGWLSFWEH